MAAILAENQTTKNWTMSEQVIAKFYIYNAVMLPIGLLGIVGNTVSFFVLHYQSKRHLAANRFILLKALAVADTFYLLTTLLLLCYDAAVRFTGIVGLYNSYIYILPPMYGFNNIAMLIANWLLVGVSAERSIAITKPFRATRLLRRRNIYIFILLTCLLSFLLNLPHFFEQTVGLDKDSELSHDYHREVPTIITHDFFYNDVYMFVYNGAITSISAVFAPLALLVYYNMKLMKELRRMRTNMHQNPTNQRTGSDLRLTKMVIVVVMVFIVCHMPSVLVSITYLLGTIEHKVNVKFMHIFHPIEWYIIYTSYLAMVINSSVNFIIYYITNQTYRKAFCDIFCTYCRRYAPHKCCQIFAGNFSSSSGWTVETVSLELSTNDNDSETQESGRNRSSTV